MEEDLSVSVQNQGEQLYIIAKESREILEIQGKVFIKSTWLIINNKVYTCNNITSLSGNVSLFSILLSIFIHVGSLSKINLFPDHDKLYIISRQYCPMMKTLQVQLLPVNKNSAEDIFWTWELGAKKEINYKKISEV